MVLSAVLVLFVCEVAYRSYVMIRKPLYRPSSLPRIGWEFTPGAVNRPGTPEEERGAWYAINHHGFRDARPVRWKGWGVNSAKFVFIGDSVTFGATVNFKQTYPKMLESFFTEAPRKVSTVNLAVEATNTLQHQAILKYKAVPLEPDAVILGYFMNDLEQRRIEKFPKSVRFMLRHFHLATFLGYRFMVSKRAREYAETQAAEENATSSPEPAKERACSSYERSVIALYNTEAWRRSQKVLSDMADLAQQAGIRFGVVLFPFEGQLSGQCQDRPQRLLHAYFEASGIPYLDMLEVYKREQGAQRFYSWDNFIHPNVLGYSVAAEAISRWLWATPAFRELLE